MSRAGDSRSAPCVADPTLEGAIIPTIIGTAGNDTLAGMVADDIINGLDGNDRLSGGAGIDKLDGGANNDNQTTATVLIDGEGNDILDGGIANGHPHPATIAAIRAWMPKAEARGFVIVPLSAVAKLRLGASG